MDVSVLTPVTPPDGTAILICFVGCDAFTVHLTICGTKNKLKRLDNVKKKKKEKKTKIER